MTTATLSPSTAKTKFRLAGGAQPLILLPVEVNGEGPFEFILDTGAGTSLLSSELGNKLGIKVLGSKEGQSAGGAVSVSLARVNSLAVGSAKLEDVDVGLVDLSHIGKTVGAQIDGDLGYNFLKHFRLTLDYRKTEIRLDDPRRVELAGQSTAITEVAMRLASPAKPLILVEVYAMAAALFNLPSIPAPRRRRLRRSLQNSSGLRARRSALPPQVAHMSMSPRASCNHFRWAGPGSTICPWWSPISLPRSAVSLARSWTALSAIIFCAITKSRSIIPTKR
jgi:hypothetical protein